jgi:hypothetical protein
MAKKLKKSKDEAYDVNVEPVPTFDLKLTQQELLHLRDLFNVRLPPDMTTTVSQALATAEGRPFVENLLFLKVHGACKSAKLPLEESAPDFVVTATGPAPMGVFKVAFEEPAFAQQPQLLNEE